MMHHLVDTYQVSQRWLPEIQGLEKYEDGISRGYYYKGKLVPYSITEVVDITQEFLKKRYLETKHEWQPRGNTVHACMEQFLRGRSFDPGNYKEWTDALTTYDFWDDWEAIATEYKLLDLKNGIAGTADAIVRNKKDHNKIALVDLKTKKDKISFGHHEMQLGGYLNLIRETFPQLKINDAYIIYVGKSLVDRQHYNKSECFDCIDLYTGQRRAFLKQQEAF
nr:DNA replication factor Dna2-like nuclease [uncultured Mediterranean phage uvMED]